METRDHCHFIIGIHLITATASLFLIPFPVREDQGGKTNVPIWGVIKMGDGKRELGGFPLGREGEDVCHLEQGHRSW